MTSLRSLQVTRRLVAQRTMPWAALAMSVFAGTALPDSTSASYEKLWNEATADGACAIVQEAKVQRVECRERRIVFYFTKPEHLAHHGVVKRALIKEANGYYVNTDGYCFDSATRANCERWIAAFKARDAEKNN